MITLRSIDRAEALSFYRIHPHLRDMWKRYYWNSLVAFFLRDKTDGHVARWAKKDGDGDRKPHEVLVIEKDGQSIGITGFFKTDDCPKDTLRLRWTAIMEKEQGVGAANEMIDRLCDYIHERFPDIKWISESCPVWAKSLRRWWRRNGFEAWDDPDKNGTGIWFVRTVSLRRRVA